MVFEAGKSNPAIFLKIFEKSSDLKSEKDKLYKLSVENQLEVVLSELPNQIANVFIVEDKLNCTRDEILDFCDVIQEFCESANVETSTQPAAMSTSDLGVILGRN